MGLGFLCLVLILLLAYRQVVFGPSVVSNRFEGQVIPNVELSSVGQEKLELFKLLETKPGKKFIISMWATWCEPCVRELPLVQKNIPRLQARNTEVLLINYDGGNPDKTMVEVRAWLTAQKIGLDTHFDFSEMLLQKLEIEGLPYTVQIDENKKITKMDLGELDWNTL